MMSDLCVSATIILSLVSASLLHCSAPCSIHHVTKEGVVGGHSYKIITVLTMFYCFDEEKTML